MGVIVHFCVFIITLQCFALGINLCISHSVMKYGCVTYMDSGGRHIALNTLPSGLVSLQMQIYYTDTWGQYQKYVEQSELDAALSCIGTVGSSVLLRWGKD